MIGNGDIFIAPFSRGLDHFLCRVFSVAPGGVHVEITADILQLDDIRQLALSCRFHLTPVLTQHRRYVWQTELFEDLFLFGAANAFVIGIEQSVLVQLESLLDGALPHADVMRLRPGEVVHRSTPCLDLDNPQIDLQIVLHANGRLCPALRQHGLDEGHGKKRFHGLLDVGRCGENVDVVDDFLHPAQAAGISHTFGVFLEIAAELSCDRHCPSQQIIATAPAIDLDPFQDVLDGLLFESWNSEQLVRFTKRFQLFDRLNLESVVNFFCRLGTYAGNFDDLRQPQGNVLLQFLMKLNLPGADVLIDFAGQVFANARNVSQRPVHSQRLDVVGQASDVDRGPAVCAHTKGVCALNFQKIGNLIEDERNLKIPHAQMITKHVQARSMTVLFSGINEIRAVIDRAYSLESCLLCVSARFSGWKKANQHQARRAARTTFF